MKSKCKVHNADTAQLSAVSSQIIIMNFDLIIMNFDLIMMNFDQIFSVFWHQLLYIVSIKKINLNQIIHLANSFIVVHISSESKQVRRSKFLRP